MSDLITRLCRPGYDLQKEQAIQEAIIEITRLRAKIEAMEKQEPVASVWRCDNGHLHGSCKNALPMGTKLYAIPGAKGEREHRRPR